MGGLDSGKVGRWEGWRQPKTQKVRFFFLKSWGGASKHFFFNFSFFDLRLNLPPKNGVSGNFGMGYYVFLLS